MITDFNQHHNFRGGLHLIDPASYRLPMTLGSGNLSWYKPASHRLHSILPGSSWYSPACWKEPCTNFITVLTAHFQSFNWHLVSRGPSQITTMATPRAPALHGLQANEAPESWLVPAAHGTQTWVTPPPSTSFCEKLPGRQAFHEGHRLAPFLATLGRPSFRTRTLAT